MAPKPSVHSMGDVQAELLGIQAALDNVGVGGWPQKVRSGFYVSNGGAGGVGGATQDRLWLAPIIIPSAITVIEANINVTTAVASTVFRGGIYSDDGNGAPLNLLYAFPSTFDTSTTGLKTQAISTSIAAGIFWVGGAIQGGSGTNFTVGGGIPAVLLVNQGQAQALAMRCYYQDAVSGALPAQFTFVLANVATVSPLITLKVQ